MGAALSFSATELESFDRHFVDQLAGLTDEIVVVIVHFRAIDWCVATAKSLLASTGVHTKIFVVDNSDSIDLESLLPDGVTLIRNDTNLGYSGGANVVLREWLGRQSGAYVLVASHDLEVAPNAVAALISVLVQDQRVGIVGPHRTHAREPRSAPAAQITVTPRQWLNGSCLVFRRECLQDIGLFDEGFGSYVEDVDLCLRAWDRGWVVASCDDVVVATRGSSSTSRDHLIAKNSVLLAAKRRGPLGAAAEGMLQAIAAVLYLCSFFLYARDPKRRRECFSGARLRARRPQGRRVRHCAVGPFSEAASVTGSSEFSEDRPLSIYWYWPHPHRTASRLLLSAMRRDDEYVVQALPTFRGESLPPIVEYEIIRNLPDPTVPRTGVRRLLRPIELTCGRSLARRRLVRRGFDVGVIELLVYRTDWFDLRGVHARLPLVSVVHDVRPHVHTLPIQLETALLRRLYSEDCAGELIVYNHVLRDDFVADLGVQPDRVHVVPLPFDGSSHRASVPYPDRPLVLFFGALRPNKGLPVLLAALEQLPPDPGFDVIVAGAGDTATCDLLRRSAERLPFLSVECGFVEESRKAELYNQASLIVLPYTEFHSVSAVLADAYGYRVPVVVSNVGSLGEMVRADATGWVVPKNDPAALSDTLRQAMAALDEDSRRAAITERIAEAARCHDYSIVGPKFRAACVTAVERERRRR